MDFLSLLASYWGQNIAMALKKKPDIKFYFKLILHSVDH